MRYGVIADVHANDRALNAVFEHAQKNSDIDSWWFLGDAVGYGPFPLQTLRLLKDRVLNTQWMIGNHDAMFVGLIPLKNANEGAEWIIERHQEILQQQDEDLWNWCLENWTLQKSWAVDVHFPKLYIRFAHAALEVFGPLDQIELYLFPWKDTKGVDYKPAVLKELAFLKKPKETGLLIHGHTHVPYAMGIRKKQTNMEYLPIQYDVKLPVQLSEFDTLLINPGSVGLPRNADPMSHADYGVLDTNKGTFQFCRVPYKKVEEVINAMYQQDYPIKYRQFLQGAHANNPLHSQPQKAWEWLEWNRRYKWNGNGWDVISQE